MRVRQRSKDMQADILAVLRQCGAPMSAYKVLDRLRDGNPRLAPPTIYRALAALIGRGMVHRLESLNAFVACRCEQHGHVPIFSICEDCGTVEEAVSQRITNELSRIAGQSGFAPARHVIEVHGHCARCESKEAPA